MASQQEDDDVQMEDEQEQTDSLMYDPDQDVNERREIRKQYRELQENEVLQNAASATADQLASAVEKTDVLFDQVRGPQDATLDSNVLVRATNAVVEKARHLRADTGGFDVDDFVAKLITFMGGRRQGEELPVEDEDDEMEDDQLAGDAPLDWEKIGRKALAKSRRVPAMDFMLGPLSVEQKKRNVGKRNRLDKSKEEETRPQEVKEDDIQKSENETTKNVIEVHNILERCGRINLFRFVVNPENFGQTVENLFYLSFLIRDGKVAVDEDEETAEPVIYSCEPPGDEEYNNGVKKRQMVMELDMETWKRAIDVFQITKSTIPTRAPSQLMTGNKWYG